jgi:hypothetical protein
MPDRLDRKLSDRRERSMTSSATAVQNSRLERLLRFLESDPTNLPLMGDTAATAYGNLRSLPAIK